MNNENAVSMKITVNGELLPGLYQRLAALSGRKRQLLMFKYLSVGELAIHGGVALRSIGAVTPDDPTSEFRSSEDEDANDELAKAFLDFSDSFTKKPN